MTNQLRSRCLMIAAALATLPAPQVALAQTDYYNTDAGRPLRIEDAYPVERRAFEIQAAPVRLERSRNGLYHWSIEPELAYGVLPHTQIEVGFPIGFIDAGNGNGTAGLEGIDASILYNLNTETSLPALALAAGVTLPVGHLSTRKTYGSIKGIATRTFQWARFHVNGEYTIGDALPAEEPTAESVSRGADLSRWLAGIGIDRALPLRSLLLAAEIFAEESLQEGAEVDWSAGVGARYQVSPRITIDAGVGRQLTGEGQTWHTTFGAALAFGLPWHP